MSDGPDLHPEIAEVLRPFAPRPRAPISVFVAAADQPDACLAIGLLCGQARRIGNGDEMPELLSARRRIEAAIADAVALSGAAL